MVVDCDVHHGNGTAAIFADDPLGLHALDPPVQQLSREKAASTVDIHLADGVGDDGISGALLERGYRFPSPAFSSDLLVYVAGADPYCEDQLGGMYSRPSRA